MKFDDYGGIGLGSSQPAQMMGGVEISKGTVDMIMAEAANLALSEEVTAGTLLRGSSADRSPFLLQKQELHHSLLLVILEDDNVSLGCMLNHPATKGYDVGGGGGTASIPIRYGGDYAIKGQSPLLWLHCNPKLRDAGLGSSFREGRDDGMIYKCTQEEAKVAISRGMANANDFLIMSGVCVWPKLGGSLANEVKRGTFEVVEPSKVQNVFATLQKQKLLTVENLEKNIDVMNEAWNKAARKESSKTTTADDRSKSADDTLTLGIGEGYDEDDDTIVFNSDKKVSELANDALKKWIATFLLGAPTLA